jgi:PII-like signaling protein
MSGGSTMKNQFPARMLRIHFGEGDKWQGKPMYESIVSKCKELGIAGATVYRGIEGYGASTRIRHSSHWKFSQDAPMMLTIIDKEEQIERLIPHLDTMVQEGLIAMSRVEVTRYSRKLETAPDTPSGKAE